MSATAIERVQEVRDRLVREGLVIGSDGQRQAVFPIAIGPKQGLALRDRVVEESASQTLEVGLAFGVSTLFICEGLLANGSNGPHVAIDPYQMKPSPTPGTMYAGVGLRTLVEADVRDLVEFYEEESQIVLPRLLADGRRFDLAFIDGNHRFEAVFLDLIYSGRLVKEGGVVFVDDVQLPGVRRGIEFCISNLGWTEEEQGNEGPSHEWRVLRTGPEERFVRPFTDFVDFD